MKKILLLTFLLLFPVIVFAEAKVTSHLIDAEIEIGGALSVKELIIVEKDTDFISRKLNYYSFGNASWDGKTIDLDKGTIYNGQNVTINAVSAFEFDDKVSFGEFDKNVTEYFSAFDITKPTSNTYTYTDNKDGTGSLKIFHKTNGKKTAYYIKYVVTNVVVKHNDVKEINYTFKNLNYHAKETFLRVIIPYETNDELYHVWVHGNQKGEVQELVTNNESKVGIIAKFPEIGSEINFRMTLPQEQVGVDIYLNNSNIDALSEIIKIENDRLNQTTKSNNIIYAMKYVLIALSVIYVLCTIIFIKKYNRNLFIIYVLFGIFIMVFNYLFRFNYWYLYLLIVVPIILVLLKKYLQK